MTPSAPAPLSTARLTQAKGASMLLGKKVHDANGKSVGKLDDLVLDVAGGEVIVGLVSPGRQPEVVPVPVSIFGPMFQGEIELRVDRKATEGAPRVGKPPVGAAPEANSLVASFGHFKKATPQKVAGKPTLSSAASLIGCRLVSEANEPLGQVSDIMVDLYAGRIVYLVIQPTAGPDAQTSLYLVPPFALTTDASKRALVLNADQKHFLAGPHCQKQFPTEMLLPNVAIAVYQHYGLLGTPVQAAASRPAAVVAEVTPATPAALAKP